MMRPYLLRPLLVALDVVIQELVAHHRLSRKRCQIDEFHFGFPAFVYASRECTPVSRPSFSQTKELLAAREPRLGSCRVNGRTSVRD